MNSLAHYWDHVRTFASQQGRDERQHAGIQRTFGYFTRHPVSPLNRARLQLLLQGFWRKFRQEFDARNPSSDPKPQLRPPIRILDVACGGGVISQAFALQPGTQVLGVDIDSSEIDLARRFAVHLQGATITAPARFELLDVLADRDWRAKVEGWLGGRPHGVILGYALHHLENVERFLDELGEWLPPGARLWINEENPHSPMFRLKHWVRERIQHDTEVEHHRSFGEWKALLERAGFEVDARPLGVDLVPGLGSIAPRLSWSLVFEARKEAGKEPRP